jgi:hypothetical protein
MMEKAVFLSRVTDVIDASENWSYSFSEILREFGLPANYVFRTIGTRAAVVVALQATWVEERDRHVAQDRVFSLLESEIDWLVNRRARIVFLVSETCRLGGKPFISDLIDGLLPDFRDVASYLDAQRTPFQRGGLLLEFRWRNRRLSVLYSSPFRRLTLTTSRIVSLDGFFFGLRLDN